MDYILIGNLKEKKFIPEFSRYLQIIMLLNYNMILFQGALMNPSCCTE